MQFFYLCHFGGQLPYMTDDGQGVASRMNQAQQLVA
jgi:hypothetical protein